MESDSSPYHIYPMPPVMGTDGPVEKVAVIGYGNQGRAQALNLKDSGLPVIVGLREKSLSRKMALAEGLKVDTIENASKQATAIILLVPDEFLSEVAETVMGVASPGSILVLAHGASLHFGRWAVREGFDCGLVAPHGPGIEVRRLYLDGGGSPAILAEVQDFTGRCRKRIELLAAAIGCSRKGAGVRWSTLREEVETDLFVEQALLVGGVIELLRAVVTTMVRAGYDPAICRMSTLYELPHIAIIYDRLGVVDSFKAISPTAAFGAATRGPRLVDQHTRHVLDDMLEEIRDGSFVRELLSPEAPLVLNNYISALESSNLAAADNLFAKKSSSKSDKF
jgi:ketol-acid reductoisomerase